MQKLQEMLKQARDSDFSKWKLNFFLKYILPFNAPHQFKIKKISPDGIETFAPNRKRNFNHLKGIHACAIATVGELAAGLSLYQYCSPSVYRLIMASMEVKYHYQAKQDLTAICKFSAQDAEQVMQELKSEDKLMKQLKTDVFDQDENHIATVTTHWQVKRWDKCRAGAKPQNTG